jgi:hypothetical protein
MLEIPLDNIFNLSAISKTEAFQLLRKRLDNSQIEDTVSTEKLLLLLVNTPLVIEQASTYMNKPGVTTTKYLDYCQSSHHTFVQLLSEEFDDKHRYKSSLTPVTTTWLISFNYILKQKPPTAGYLKFISLLSEREIPKAMFPIGNTGMETEEAIGVLRVYAFLNERANSGFYDTHRLVRLAKQNWMRAEGELEAYISQIF